MDRVLMVSSDSHASVPSSAWPEYLEQRYHEYLPRLQKEDELYTKVLWVTNDACFTADASNGMAPEYEVFDKDQIYRSGRYWGLWDANIRLDEMNRDGIAAEVVHLGDFRVMDLFHNVMNATYPLDAWDAGARAYDRWAADTFFQGEGKKRFLLVGAIGSCSDMETAVAELRWIAEHGFVGTYAPGYMTHPEMPPLYDAYWNPFWSSCEELGLAVVFHAGWGNPQGLIYPELERCFQETKAVGGTDLDLLQALVGGIFNIEFFADVKARRALGQLLLTGVFDRHPGLKVAMTEQRADWLPTTMRYFDAVYEENRGTLAAKRPPHEYWATNCILGLSFIHRAEVQMRDEIGTESIAFGRDYPHAEGTWPNTREFLRAAFSGVPERDLRLMLGGNAVRFFSLDSIALQSVANRVGYTIDEITGPGPDIDPTLLAHLNRRCGILKPSEGDAQLHKVETMVREDLVQFAEAGR